MRKIIAALLAVGCLLTAVSCKQDETHTMSSDDPMVGEWRGTKDWTEELNNRWFSDEEGYAFEGLTVEVIWTLYGDRYLTVDYDEDSIASFKSKMTEQIEPYLRSLVEESAAAAGKSAEDYCMDGTGLSFDETVSGAIEEYTEGLDDTFAMISGYYVVRDGNILVHASERESLNEATEGIRFTLSEDTLTLEEVVPLGETSEEPDSEEAKFYPLTLTRSK